MMLPFPQGPELTSRQTESFIRKVNPSNMEVMPENETAGTAGRDWDPSKWVYSMVPQVHTCGRRGMGGRSLGSTIDVRCHFKSLLSFVISSALIGLDSKSNLRLRDFFDDLAVTTLNDIHSEGLDNLYKNYFGLLPGNLLGIYAKFTYRDTPTVPPEIEKNGIANSRNRHLLCTWLDRQGNFRCSCIGKNLFSAKSNMKQFSIPCCARAKDAYDFFKALMPKETSNAFEKTHRTLSCLSLAIMDAHSVPNPFEGYKSASLFLPYKDYAEFGSCGEKWAPIRRTGKRSNILICALCDMHSETNCEHIKEWSRIQELGSHQEPHEESDPGNGPEFTHTEENIGKNDEEDDVYLEERMGRSYLPIAPINCPKSVHVDIEFGDLVMPREEFVSDSPVFVVHAPLRCAKCDTERDETSRMEMGEGFLSCTMGPVRIQVVCFKCNTSNCGAFIYKEGRSQHIVFYSISSAATDAFMRREVQAVCLSGVIINYRFNNYLLN